MCAVRRARAADRGAGDDGGGGGGRACTPATGATRAGAATRTCRAPDDHATELVAGYSLYASLFVLLLLHFCIETVIGACKSITYVYLRLI